MRITLALAAVVVGCYSPSPPTGAPCVDGVCPSGLVCSPATNTCETIAIDAARADGISIDARPIDGPPLDAPLPAPMLVQQQIAEIASGTMVAATLADKPKSGNVLLAIAGAPAGGLTGISGGGVMTWTPVVASYLQTNIEVFIGVTNGTSSTVTASYTPGGSEIRIFVSEWSGLSAPNLVDDASASGGPGTVASVSAGSITTSHARDLLVFAAAAFQQTTFGVPSPGAWVPMQKLEGAVYQGQWYQVVDATGTYAPAVTHTSGGWDAAVVAIRISP